MVYIETQREICFWILSLTNTPYAKWRFTHWFRLHWNSVKSSQAQTSLFLQFYGPRSELWKTAQFMWGWKLENRAVFILFAFSEFHERPPNRNVVIFSLFPFPPWFRMWRTDINHEKIHIDFHRIKLAISLLKTPILVIKFVKTAVSHTRKLFKKTAKAFYLPLSLRSLFSNKWKMRKRERDIRRCKRMFTISKFGSTCLVHRRNIETCNSMEN